MTPRRPLRILLAMAGVFVVIGGAAGCRTDKEPARGKGPGGTVSLLKERNAVPAFTATDLTDSPLDTYMQAWRALSPAERLRRSWLLRRRIRNLEAVHDEKSLPKL